MSLQVGADSPQLPITSGLDFGCFSLLWLFKVTTLTSVILGWYSVFGSMWEEYCPTIGTIGSFTACGFLILCAGKRVSDSSVVLAASVTAVFAGIVSARQLFDAQTVVMRPHWWHAGEVTRCYASTLLWNLLLPVVVAYCAVLLQLGPLRLLQQWRCAIPGIITTLSITINACWIPEAIRTFLGE